MTVESKSTNSGDPSRGEPVGLISARDIIILLSLPILGLVAWLVPDRHWPRVTGAIARAVSRALRSCRPSVFERIRFTTDNNAAMGPATDIYVRLFAGRVEQELQYLREYRPGGWHPKLSLVGREHLDRAAAGDRGGILWVAPMLHSSLLAKKALHEAGFQVAHLSREFHGPSDTRFGRNVINRISVECESRYLMRRIAMQSGRESAALRQLVRTLRQGQLISISCSHYGRKIVDAPLLGAKLPIAVGAASLAMTTGAPLMPVFIVRKGPQDFEIVIEEPMELPTGGDQDEMITQIVYRYAMRIEEYALRDPSAFTDWRRLLAPDAGPQVKDASR
jgi:lauroyl/myristoyl acyltransferase